MPELLLEVGCEEIPAEDLFVLQDEIPAKAKEAFQANRISCKYAEAQVTPRRLALKADLDAMQQDLQEVRMGPPRKVAFDAAGNPTPAGLGFAKNLGVTLEQLKTVDTPKGEYLACEILVKGKPTSVILPELISTLVSSLSFKKYMRWGTVDFVFGRPIRNLVLLFQREVIPLTIAGVSSDRFTFGHRFLGKAKISVRSYSEYRKKLEANGVILRFEDRASKITKELQLEAEKSGGAVALDPDLLRIMANEVEYPEVLSGSFSPDFLFLPKEILINAMRKHQKYFCILNPDGSLKPAFLTVLNTHAVHPEAIREGHERVLVARLNDAGFFWKEDQKKKLAERVPALERITYIEKLGSYQDKVNRMKKIGEAILSQHGQQDRASSLYQVQELAKADLTTLMVGEFPELQGIIGGLYANLENYPEETWQAIYDQYKPTTAEDSVPRGTLGALLSLTERIDTLAAGYTMNMIPTGSKDPYALRRIATGAVRILLEHRLDLNLQPVLDHALSLFSWKTKLTREEMLHGLMDLLQARFRFLMEEKGIAQDYMDAILNAEKQSLLLAKVKLEALWSIRQSPDLISLARGFKRINNIIAGLENEEFDPELLQEDGEKRLSQVFDDLQFRVDQLIQEKRYSEALEIMVTLGKEIDNFFDEVLVMAEDPKIRKNRIALLKRISDLYRKLADFSALQIEI
jgi:glycyl-tRNA synthetase beta chain